MTNKLTRTTNRATKPAKDVLTERALRKALPPSSGRRIDWDAELPGFGFMQTSKASKGTGSFILYKRYPGSSSPARRALGDFPAMKLEAAKGKARKWLGLISRGIDPKKEEERERRANTVAEAMTVTVVAEDFKRIKLDKERQGEAVYREMKRELLSVIGESPISDVAEETIQEIIEAIRDRGAPSQARNILGYAKRFFGWVASQKKYGLPRNPANGIKPAVLLGKRGKRRRLLSNDELWAFWTVTSRWPYPIGPAYRLLALSALRLNEAVDAQKREFNHPEQQWIVPAERMKTRDDDSAEPHLIPITRDISELLASLPKPTHKNGYIFSHDGGEKPVWVTTRVKNRLDKEMLEELKALAAKRGNDPEDVKLPPFVNHDIRRTVRSHLSRIKINGRRLDHDVSEAILAHKRPGVWGTYDLYDRAEEKAEALEGWALRLKGIVTTIDKTTEAVSEDKESLFKAEELRNWLKEEWNNFDPALSGKVQFTPRVVLQTRKKGVPDGR